VLVSGKSRGSNTDKTDGLVECEERKKMSGNLRDGGKGINLTDFSWFLLKNEVVINNVGRCKIVRCDSRLAPLIQGVYEPIKQSPDCLLFIHCQHRSLGTPLAGIVYLFQ
jgi:hypothetical protein